MARITVEDCLEKVNNRFELILMASQRVKQLLQGSHPQVDCDNKEIVTALREIASGVVKKRESTPDVTGEGGTV